MRGRAGSLPGYADRRGIVRGAGRGAGLWAARVPSAHGRLSGHESRARVFNEDLRRKRAELEIDIPVKGISDVDDEILFGDEPAGQ
jgi:hypothetical protein